MKFGDWLRRSNEAAPFRLAFDAIDQVPQDFGLRAACFEQVRAKAENCYRKTKDDLSK